MQIFDINVISFVEWLAQDNIFFDAENWAFHKRAFFYSFSKIIVYLFLLQRS